VTPLLYLCFFLSGISGLVYQVVWVREFGHAFGNTLHSASLIVAIFMLGLGAGGYAIGQWADRRYATGADSLLRAYAWIELAIAGLGLVVSLLLPQLDAIVAASSAYARGADGWYALTPLSYLSRGMIATLLLAPITVLMGGTLTLLIRYAVRAELAASGWNVSLLYGVNTAGAAAGAFLTDFYLVPAAGLLVTQLVAVALNLLAGGGAWLLSRRRVVWRGMTAPRHAGRKGAPRIAVTLPAPPVASPVAWTSAALALSGFAALGLEILWLRHMTLLLGGFRAVFSLLITVMLIGLGLGALLGGWADRRVGRPAVTLMGVQGLFVVTALLGLGAADARSLDASAAPGAGALADVWFNVRPMLLEVGLPALLAGFTYPLANALVQRSEAAVGRRAGVLYLANTAGAVAGSLVTGYLLLPLFGMQGAAAVLAFAGALAIVPLILYSREFTAGGAAAGVAVAALAAWFALPADHMLGRALVPQTRSAQPERTLVISEGATELIQVVEIPGLGRGLVTNGHAMASTAPLDQRYMRALAHIPLLTSERPERVLVIGFGVGNSTHAATLHPTVQRVEVADLSRHILEHASYFRDANRDVLSNGKVSVYINDGRQHLLMADAAAYDLITLEPPPIAYAGVGALYSREFYELARTRLTTGGHISQWLPAYQVPAESSLAMIRAFIDAFPQAVLLSGNGPELMLLGTTGPALTVDPDRLAASLLLAPPPLSQDLARIDLGSPREIIGAFVGSGATLRNATLESAPATDDRPLQEYGVRSRLGADASGVPASIFDLGQISSWCPRCFEGGDTAPAANGLDLYLALMEEAYGTSPASVASAAAARRGGTVMGSRYLASVLPELAEVRRVVGLAKSREGAELLALGELAGAVTVLREAVRLAPESAEAHNDLGVALASSGAVAEAREYFRRAVALQPDFAEARDNLARAGG
jgi:spermidine synthase